MSYAAGRLWVACTTSGQLADIDPGSRQLVRRIPFASADGLAQDGASLLVTSDNGPSVALLDPRTAELSHKIRLSQGLITDANADVAVAGGFVWVSSPDEGALYRVPARWFRRSQMP